MKQNRIIDSMRFNMNPLEKYSWLIAVFVALVLSGMTPASARVVFEDDFQDGNADGWAGNAGRGDLRLTTFAGNVSVRLTRDASIVRRIEVNESSTLDVSVDIAATGLEKNDICKVEVSTDAKNWQLLGVIGDGKDDGTTLHNVRGSIDAEKGIEYLLVGLRVDGNAENDICWFDNINVTSQLDFGLLQHELPHAVYWSSENISGAFSTAVFETQKNAGIPKKNYSGTLNLKGGPVEHFEVYNDAFEYYPENPSIKTLPSLSISFVQNGSAVIPVTRGAIKSDHPDWEWIIEPGNIWLRDDGEVQISLPFALMERNANCVHNGLLTFRINQKGQTSSAIYQIGAETCAYLQFDLWGTTSVDYAVHEVEQFRSINDAYTEELSARLETKPIENLPNAKEYGASDEVAPSSMTLYGYVDGPTHYVGGCETRFGSYPFCDVMDVPSYSWAKSLVGGVGLMRLEKIYPNVKNALVSDYVPACTTDDWAGVRFEDLLDMASGVYNSDVYDEDESSAEMRAFFVAPSHTEKIEIACKGFARQQEPGKRFVYRTADTYILGVAMNAFLRVKTEDIEADFYDDLIVPIWNQLGLSPLVNKTRRTYDHERQPFTGWGLVLHRNDIALISNFLQRGGRIEGEPVLDEEMLSAAFQQNPDDRGLPAVIDEQRYQNGFWAWNAGPSLRCEGDEWIPAMSGYGGLSAAFMPNGSTYYYISDGYAFAWRRAAIASNKQKPFCEGTE
ncbi:serine hydrolase domain-containing protein [Hyphococcus lacteus]|uniref:Beta-lactamase-related domain-containing protein n=1 Tax=Hyphococcus lacteus TaxID=3143536 RepID=A0ABV3Z582_9PROT